MEIRPLDSAMRAPRSLEPLDPGHVRLYVCGPTVYDPAHLGNAAPAAVFDGPTPLLCAAFPRATYMRNIIDGHRLAPGLTDAQDRTSRHHPKDGSGGPSRREGRPGPSEIPPRDDR